MRHLRELLGAFLAVIAFTVVLGLVYPLVMTGVSQVAFPTKADGDRALIQSAPRHPVNRYFYPRPSATGYSATATYFANRGPNATAAVDFYKSEIARYLKREARYSPGLTAGSIPIDAVTASASGVDPQISVANAEIQARRIAQVRGISANRVRALIAAHTSGRFLGLYGEPGVNVDTLNNALDQEAR